MTGMFLMTADVAIEVYEAFLHAEALSEEERIKVLMEFVDAGKVQYSNVNASKEEVAKALIEHFKIVEVHKNDSELS